MSHVKHVLTKALESSKGEAVRVAAQVEEYELALKNKKDELAIHMSRIKECEKALEKMEETNASKSKKTKR